MDVIAPKPPLARRLRLGPSRAAWGVELTSENGPQSSAGGAAMLS